MQQKWLQTTEIQLGNESAYFISETIEVDRLSALAFFAAGVEFKGQRYIWQNRAQTLSLVGLGQAYAITNDASEERFDAVEKQWKQFTKNLPNLKVQPILFGGFAFDPMRNESAQWATLPHSTFMVATYQLMMNEQGCFVTIHAITKDQHTEQILQPLREKRDELLFHANQKQPVYEKPTVTAITEPGKDQYLQ